MDFLVLGAGYTGERVAAALLDRGAAVQVTTRDPGRLAHLAARGARVHRLVVEEPDSLRDLAEALPAGVRILHSLPVVEGPQGPREPTPAILEALGALPGRIVYLSTTGVYGTAQQVDETTPVAANTERTLLRVAAERAVAAGPWSWMVLRPAAIYGRERGVHVAMRSGRYRLPGSGENFVSRIHVEDLAALAVAALHSDATGAFPVADAAPARAREVAAIVAKRFGLPMPPSAPLESLHETSRSDRYVDGSAVRRLLGVELRFPSLQDGLEDAG